jgi:hypothetical protein
MKLSLLFFTTAKSQILAGSQRDTHNCVLDGGYQWCESTQSCIRNWETPCVNTILNSNCDNRRVCPPLPVCPMPYISDLENCILNVNNDNCGCSKGCPFYECSNACNDDTDCIDTQFCRVVSDKLLLGGRRLQTSTCIDKVDIGENCGGYVLPQYQNKCLDGLECINTMGPMISDSPGICKTPCSEINERDNYGNCVNTHTIPENCATWYDGCNTCQISSGNINICTRMYCFTQNTPYCMNFNIKSKSLNNGDLCYRFCEDNSQIMINRKSDCPKNTICKSSFNEHSVSMIAYDSCDSRGWTCQTLSH